MESLRYELVETIDSIIKSCKAYRDYVADHYAEDLDDVTVFKNHFELLQDDLEIGIRDIQDSLRDMKHYLQDHTSESESDSDDSNSDEIMQDETDVSASLSVSQVSSDF